MKRILFLKTSLCLFGYENHKPQQDPIPKHYTFELKYELVNEIRIINVWTPPSYRNGNQKYPVLYMADGGIKEDFPHIANTVSKLKWKYSNKPNEKHNTIFRATKEKAISWIFIEQE